MRYEVSEIVHAYTPGLKVKRATIVRKIRRLPLSGENLVNQGDFIDYETPVARTYILGDPHLIRAAHLLGLQDDPKEVLRYMVKKIGDPVEEGEVIAKYSLLFGLIKKSFTSPIKGVLESFSESSGYMVFREPQILVEVKAYVPGKVVEVLPMEGVVVELNAAFIQGIFGIGGETKGIIKMSANSREDVLDSDSITSDDKGKILVGGSLVKEEAIAKAAEVGVSGIVCGGIDYKELTDLLGYKIGVAITGEEEIGLTLIVTEGFGRINMSRRVFRLLQQFQGHRAAMCGATQIRAGVLRPEIIIPHGELPSKGIGEENLAGGMRPGTSIRVIREPYFGAIGTVVSLPVELQKIKTESNVRIVEIELENGRKVKVPRANVEIIEE